MTRKMIKLLNKYSSENWSQNIITGTNNTIQETITQLKEMQNNLAHKIYNLNLSDQLEIDEEINDIQNDIRITKEIIKYFVEMKDALLNICANNCINNDKNIIFDERINLFVISDNLCPKCNVKLYPLCLDYQKITDKNIEIYEMIDGYKCPCCKRLFVSDFDIKDFDFTNTNITLDYQYLKDNILNFQDVIVLSDLITCTTKGHDIKDITAQIPLFNADGSISYVYMIMSYCEQCNLYYMLKSDFKMIESIIACKVIDQTITRNKVDTHDEIEIKQYESVLYQYGYNVKTKDNLSIKQRHLILASVVESGILTREQICSHLDTLIERGKKIEKWKSATQKWQQDRAFIKNYNVNNLPDILLEKVILKYRIDNYRHM